MESNILTSEIKSNNNNPSATQISLPPITELKGSNNIMPSTKKDPGPTPINSTPKNISASSDPKFNSEKTYKKLIQGIKEFFKKTNFKKGVIGLSGGIDSTITYKLCVDALGSENVTALLMPEIGVTKQENITHAKKLAEYFETKTIYQPINPFLIDYKALPWTPAPLAQMNTKARIRMTLLYNYSNTYNALVLGTSNRSEILLGYGTKHGDLACDVEIIGELYKTEVYELSRFLEIPEEIINKKPSAELAPNQTDEEDLGASYEELDTVLKNLRNGPEDATAKGIDLNLAKKIWERVGKNLHKSQLPPTIEIN